MIFHTASHRKISKNWKTWTPTSRSGRTSITKNMSALLSISYAVGVELGLLEQYPLLLRHQWCSASLLEARLGPWLGPCLWLMGSRLIPIPSFLIPEAILQSLATRSRSELPYLPHGPSRSPFRPTTASVTDQLSPPPSQ